MVASGRVNLSRSIASRPVRVGLGSGGMGSEIWALVGVVVGALTAGALQIIAGTLQRNHDRRAAMAGKRYDTYMHVLEDAAGLKTVASDLFGLMAHPHDLADEVTSRRAYNAIQTQCGMHYEMHWVLSSDRVREALHDMTIDTPRVSCEHPDGTWDAELADGRLGRLINACARLAVVIKTDLQVDELLG